jgi:hypothetical protein
MLESQAGPTPVDHHAHRHRAIVQASEATVTLTEDRIDVRIGRRLRMTAAIDGLRRIEFGIEKGQPVTLILVPDSPDQTPQILTIPTDQYEAVATLLLTLAREIAEPPESAVLQSRVRDQ